MNSPHTLTSIAEAHGVNKRAVQDWLKKARANKSMLADDIGLMVGKTRHFSDEERDMLLQYAGEPRRESEPARTPEVLPPGVADPFSGIQPRPSSAMSAPGHFKATDRTLTVLDIEERVEEICSAAAVNQQQSIQEMVINGSQTGQALGAFLAQSIIQSAEEKKNAMLSQYMQSQGVSTSPKQSEPQGEPAAS